MGGAFRPSATGQAVPVKSDAMTAGSDSSSRGAGVVVDLRSAIQNLKPGMSYSIGGGYEPADITVPGDDKLRRVGVSNFLNAFSEWTDKLFGYWEQMSGFTARTFTGTSDETALLGGAATDIVRASLAAKGVVRPEMPKILKDAGAEDPHDPSSFAAARIGEITVKDRMESRADLNSLASVSFDRTVDIPDGQMSIVDLDSGDATASGLLASVLSGALGADLSAAADQPAKAGMHRYAVTNGKTGSDAVVGALLFTRGNDSAAVNRAAGLYASIKSLQRG
ncbi:hypothetical protein [Azospirillum sp. B510]|uniref:hypothetical protein n=1 Tax=Azospirillum sp. (strain B510) TaxID=137722 RepID=UPI0005A7EACE|nr:hypothetical protein [Azospirillum sp. B510]